MLSRINCVYHEEDTPSLVIYPDSFYCFGCGAKGTIEELNKKVPELNRRVMWEKARFRGLSENIKSSIAKIKALPVKSIRGFELPYDDSGYYIVYPDEKYYVKRLWDGNSSNKYRSPTGHKKPIMSFNKNSKDTVFIVEGQLNAMTLAKFADYPVLSPGSASDFNNLYFFKYYLQYSKAYIIVDKDAAGVLAGLKLRNKLIENKVKRVILHPMEKDFNDLLIESGKEEVCKETRKLLEMP